MKRIFLLLFFFEFWISNAQELVYKPINPAFGGDTFNYQWLMSSAEAQNKFKESTSSSYQQKTELERFKDNLNNQILNKISNSLFQQQFGDKGIRAGSYLFGSLSVDIYPSNLGLVVAILDTETGEQTQVIIPSN